MFIVSPLLIFIKFLESYPGEFLVLAPKILYFTITSFWS